MKNKILKLFSVICVTMTSLSFVKADIISDPIYISRPSRPSKQESFFEKIDFLVIPAIIAVLVVACVIALVMINKKKKQNNDIVFGMKNDVNSDLAFGMKVDEKKEDK